MVSCPQQCKIKANATNDSIINKILELYVRGCVSFHIGYPDSLSSKRERLVPPEPSPGLPEEQQLAERALSVSNHPDQAASVGCDPSQRSVSSPRVLGSNSSPHEDKGKGKETETADVERSQGSSEESSSSPTNVMVQHTTTSPVFPGKKKKPARRRPNDKDKAQMSNSLHNMEPILLQSQELNQANDSRESQHRGMTIHFGSVFDAYNLGFLSVQQMPAPDNGGPSLALSNSYRTALSNPSWVHQLAESRLKLETSLESVKLETILESVRDQVTDLNKTVETWKNDLDTQLSMIRMRHSQPHEENEGIRKRNTELQAEIAKIRKENADLKAQLVSEGVNCTRVCLNTSVPFQSTFSDRLPLVETLVMGKVPALDSTSSSTNLEREPTRIFGSPPPVDEVETPHTIPKVPPQRLGFASTSESTGARDIHTPFPLPTSPPLPSPHDPPGPVEIRATPQPRSQTPPESHQYRPLPTPGSPHPLVITRKRARDPAEGPEFAGSSQSAVLNASTPPLKRVKPNEEEEVDMEEDPTPFQRTGGRGERVLDHFTTPPNQTTKPFFTPNLVPRLAHAFDQGSPSPLARRTPRRTPAVGNSTPLRRRHRVPVTQPITSSTGDSIPGAPAQMVAGPASGGAGPSHTAASGTLASAVGGVLNPLSSASTPLPPAIPASGSRQDIDESQNGNGTNQGALDPLQFTGGPRAVSVQANPTLTPPSPDRSGQAAPETPMAGSTRYGTEIKPYMRNLYRYGH
jgi:hypothetical protein